MRKAPWTAAVRFVVVSACVALGSPAQSQTSYNWKQLDPTGSPYSWDTAANWNLLTGTGTGGYPGNTTDNSFDVANFGTGFTSPGTITVNLNQAGLRLNQLNFANITGENYTLAAGTAGSLNFGGTAPQLNVIGGGTVTLAAPITGSAALGGVVSNNSTLNLTNTGNTFAAGTTFAVSGGGTLSAAATSTSAGVSSGAFGGTAGNVGVTLGGPGTGGTLTFTPSSALTAGLLGREFTTGNGLTSTVNLSAAPNSSRVYAPASFTQINSTATGTNPNTFFSTYNATSPFNASTNTNFNIQFVGVLNIPTATTTFQLQMNNDDGGRIYIDGRPVFVGDGGRGIGTALTSPNLTLAAGYHTIRVDYGQGTGGYAFLLASNGGSGSTFTALATTTSPSTLGLATNQTTTTAVTAGNNVTVAGDATAPSVIQLGTGTGSANTAFGSVAVNTVTFNPGGQLTVTTPGTSTTQINKLLTAAATTLPAGAVTLNLAGADFSAGQVTATATTVLNLTNSNASGTGMLTLDNTNTTGANDFPAGAVIQVQPRTVLNPVGLVSTGSNPLDSASVTLNGGALMIDTRQASTTTATAFANTVTVTASSLVESVPVVGTLVDLGPNAAGAVALSPGVTLTVNPFANTNGAATAANGGGAVLRLNGTLTGDATTTVLVNSQPFTLTGGIVGTTGGTAPPVSGLGALALIRDATAADFTGGFTLASGLIQAQGPAGATSRVFGSTSGITITGSTTGVYLKNDGAGNFGTVNFTNNVAGTSNVPVTVGGNTTFVLDRASANVGNTLAVGNLSIGGQTLTAQLGFSNAGPLTGYALRFGATTLTGNPTINANTNLTASSNGNGVMAPAIYVPTISDGGTARQITKGGNGALLLTANNSATLTAAAATPTVFLVTGTAGTTATGANPLGTAVLRANANGAVLVVGGDAAAGGSFTYNATTAAGNLQINGKTDVVIAESGGGAVAAVKSLPTNNSLWFGTAGLLNEATSAANAITIGGTGNPFKGITSDTVAGDLSSVGITNSAASFAFGRALATGYYKIGGDISVQTNGGVAGSGSGAAYGSVLAIGNGTSNAGGVVFDGGAAVRNIAITGTAAQGRVGLVDDQNSFRNINFNVNNGYTLFVYSHSAFGVDGVGRNATVNLASGGTLNTIGAQVGWYNGRVTAAGGAILAFDDALGNSQSIGTTSVSAGTITNISTTTGHLNTGSNGLAPTASYLWTQTGQVLRSGNVNVGVPNRLNPATVWNSSGGGSPTLNGFVSDGGTFMFNDTGTTARTITGSAPFQVLTQNGTMTLGSSTSGATWTWTVPVVAPRGTVNINSASAVDGQTLNKTVNLNGSTSTAVLAAGTVNVAAGTFSASGGGMVYSVGGGTGSINLATGTAFTSGTGAMIDARVVLNGTATATWSAQTTPSAGTVETTSPTAVLALTGANAGFLVGGTNRDFTFQGQITGATQSVNKIGTGTMTWGGSGTASTVLGAGAYGGTLAIDYSASNNQKLGTGGVTFAGGRLAITGNATGTVYSLGGLTLSPGSGELSASSAGAGTTTVAVGAITRQNNATIDFQTGTGTVAYTTTTANAAGTGILGGYATFNGNDWATNNGANVVAYSGYATDDYSAAANNVNATNSAGGNYTPNATSFTVNSLRFGASEATGSTLTLTGTNVVSSGGVLVPNVAGVAGPVAIAGGTLTNAGAAATTTDLFVHQFNTANKLTINSTIADNAAGTSGKTSLVKTGPGTLTLGGSNTYTGGTVLAGGVVEYAADNNLGTTGGANTFTKTTTGFAYTGATTQTQMTITGLPNTAGVMLGQTVTSSGGFTGNGTVVNIGPNAITVTFASQTTTTISTQPTLTFTPPANLTFDGGTLRYTGASNLSTARTAYLQSNGGAVEVTGAGSLTLGGAISGLGGLTKGGSGNLILTAANTYGITAGNTTDTTAGAGTLTGGVTNFLPNNTNVTVSSGATLSLINGTTNFSTTIGSLAGSGTVNLGSSTSPATLTIGTAVNRPTTFGGKLTGAGNLAVQGIAELTLSGDNSLTTPTAAWTGKLTVGGGANVSSGAFVAFSNDNNFGAVPSSVTANAITLNGGGLHATQTAVIPANRGITLTGTTGVNYSGTFDVDGGVMLTVNSIITGASGTSLAKIGPGTLALAPQTAAGAAAANAMTSGTASNAPGFYIYSGTVQLAGPGGNSPLGSTAITAVTVQAGATLDVNGKTAPLANLFGAGSVTLGVTGNAGSLSFGADNRDSSFDGAISGTGSVTKAGTGFYLLTGTNTYTGSTSVAGGTLVVDKVDALPGTTDVSLGNAAGSATVGVPTNTSLYVNGFDVAVSSLSGGGAAGGNVALGGGSLTLNGTGTPGSPSYAGVISDAAAISPTTGRFGSLTMSGAYTQALTGASIYGGPTTITGGGVLAVTALSDAGSASPIGKGDGTTAAANAASLVLDGGTLRYTGAGTAVSNRLFTLGAGGGTIEAATGAGVVTLGNTGTAAATGTGIRTLTLAANNGAANTLAAAIPDATAADKTNLAVTGSGATPTWVLTGNSTYTGSTGVTAGATLQLGSGGTTGSIAPTSGAVVNGTLAFNRSDAVTFAAPISGSGTVSQRGGANSVVTLTGDSSTFAGATAVTAGTLRVNNVTGTYGTAASTVTVAAGAILRGNGTVGGSVQINATGPAAYGTLAPGSNLDVLKAAGDVALAPNAAFSWEVAGGAVVPKASTTPGGSNLANAGGPANTGSQAQLQLTTAGKSFTAAGSNLFTITESPATSGTLKLDVNSAYSFTVVTTTSPTTPPLAAAAAFTLPVDTASAPDFAAYQAANGVNSITITGDANNLYVTLTPSPVPEPATVGLVVAAGLGLGRLLRRRPRREVS